jgi:5-amino-6-(5-phospho-D-ribitylamino)uracil phosphatase
VIGEDLAPSRLTLATGLAVAYDKDASSDGVESWGLIYRAFGRWPPKNHVLVRIMAVAHYQILALDVDGTLLGPDGTLRPRTAAAVARAADAGIRPVLCTGRRYRRALPIALQLGIDAPLVCNSGAIVKDPKNHRTLWRADFDDSLATDVLDLFHGHGQPAVVFTDRGPHEHDFIIAAFPTGREAFDDYVSQNREHAEIDANGHWRTALPGASDRMFHICAIGPASEMLGFEEVAHERFTGRIQTFVQRSPRYLGTMCEILRHDANKWTAILHLARLWGIGPGAICAVGDDVNDIPMIENAGLGVAMGHARLEVRSAADLITGDHDEDGVAMLVDDVLLGEGTRD